MAMWLPSYDVFDAIYAGTTGVGHYFVPADRPGPTSLEIHLQDLDPILAVGRRCIFRACTDLQHGGLQQAQDSLITAGEHFFVYCIQRPRLGSSAEQKLPHWPRMVFAPAYENDSGPIWHGHK
ncbi:hypothetical protein [Cupriavidus sp. DF5525]|uniref:hypothetical protein n=1 Tax=Cupriavidus sp. DF5525 TaxID=3160989 RepID=UPI0032DFB3AC